MSVDNVDSNVENMASCDNIVSNELEFIDEEEDDDVSMKEQRSESLEVFKMVWSTLETFLVRKQIAVVPLCELCWFGKEYFVPENLKLMKNGTNIPETRQTCKAKLVFVKIEPHKPTNST